MSGRAQTYVLNDERDRVFAIRAVRVARLGLEVRVGKPKRTAEQNSLLHALISDVADQLPWPKDGDEFHDIDWWKRRCTLGWLMENRQQVEIITDLDATGEFGLLLPHTSDLNTEQCASLSEWVTAFGATNDVVFKEPKRGPEPPPAEDWR